MRMQIENVYVLTAHVGTQNVETKYVKLDLIDADDPWERKLYYDHLRVYGQGYGQIPHQYLC